MPDIEMLQLMAQLFHVSVNEILAGEFLSDEQFRKKADENIIAVSKKSAFSFEEKKAFWKKKWRRDHILLFILLAAIALVFLIVPFIVGKTWLLALLPFVVLIEYVWQNNRMMAYVEDNTYNNNSSVQNTR